jgi:hypothetical protein
LLRSVGVYGSSLTESCRCVRFRAPLPSRSHHRLIDHQMLTSFRGLKRSAAGGTTAVTNYEERTRTCVRYTDGDRSATGQNVASLHPEARGAKLRPQGSNTRNKMVQRTASPGWKASD